MKYTYLPLLVNNGCIHTIFYNKGKKTTERSNKLLDKGCTIHIKAKTMKKIEEYQTFIRKNQPEMPVPTKGQIVRSSVNYWHYHMLGA